MSSITASNLNIYHGVAASGGGGGGHDPSCISTVEATVIALNIVEWEPPPPTLCSVGCGRAAERGRSSTYIYPDGTVYVFPKCYECWNFSLDAYPMGYSPMERKVMGEVEDAEEAVGIAKKRTNWLYAKEELDKFKVELNIERSKMEKTPIDMCILLRKNLRLTNERLEELKNEYKNKDDKFDALNKNLPYMQECVISAKLATITRGYTADDKKHAINYYERQCELVTNAETKLSALGRELIELGLRINIRTDKVKSAELAAKCITRVDDLEWLIHKQLAKVDKLKADYDALVISVKSARERRIIDKMRCMTIAEIALKQQKIERLLPEIVHLKSACAQACIELQRCIAAAATADSAMKTAITAFIKDLRIKKLRCPVLHAASNAAQATSKAAYAAQDTATTAVASAKVAFESATTDLKTTEDELKRIKQLQKQ